MSIDLRKTMVLTDGIPETRELAYCIFNEESNTYDIKRIGARKDRRFP
ncbi:hypothetical protein IKF02_04365 [Candidatus Saccharibacteria bacterium]|nr:hypothetical protein [Candidatus Saccharibacteria bacterium]MBR2710821.1 hypothetical protein [Candidatus Saccharibacteria bacterium]